MQRSTPVAWAENRAKFTPAPSQVAPRGYGCPDPRCIEESSCEGEERAQNTLSGPRVSDGMPSMPLQPGECKPTRAPWMPGDHTCGAQRCVAADRLDF